MEKLFVPYELALKLKEKGFNEPCWAWYNIPDKDMRYCYSEERSPFSNSYEEWTAKCEKRLVENICIPFYQQVIDFFRTKKIKIVECEQTGWHIYKLYDGCFSQHNGMYIIDQCCDTLDKAIEEALKLI